MICSPRSRFHFKLHFNSVESILRKAHSHPFTGNISRSDPTWCWTVSEVLACSSYCRLFQPQCCCSFLRCTRTTPVELCVESYPRRCSVGCYKSYTLDLGGSRMLYAHCFMWYQKVLLKSKTKHLIVLSKARLSDALRWSTKHFV